jgi:hypothetical protein
MIFGVSAVFVITVLIVVDIALLLFRFRYVERKREELRLMCQEEIRQNEDFMGRSIKGIMAGRQEVFDSIRRMSELTEQLKNSDDDPKS